MFKSVKRVLVLAFAMAFVFIAAVPAVCASVKAEEVSAGTQIEQTADVQADEAGSGSTTETAQDDAKGSKAIAAALAVGLAAALGAIAMGIAIAKSNEAIARQPEATSQIKSGLMLGLVFIETAIIYALIVAILVIFVL